MNMKTQTKQKTANKKLVGIYLQNELIEVLDNEAKRLGTSRSGYVQNVLAHYLDFNRMIMNTITPGQLERLLSTLTKSQGEK